MMADGTSNALVYDGTFIDPQPTGNHGMMVVFNFTNGKTCYDHWMKLTKEDAKKIIEDFQTLLALLED